ncbi:MAG: DUF4351 domain-containing protein [candidate division KSB1 bacterium]|nr:DUF4351 domain-containing protein [candidate division KSB1 bacterium]MDZ7274683.1 DUF4351 domain-containing protein [candidate division KSB1 bacterium]MDZ7285508.1 DUF4351 domain-containing protein [candidate division KSB1 bacterium]MDZ7298540.1 DUF4351 domain-containing protein [candidate division KSB1 bacterium]MDZ7306608.1 DUF4351 domain-containing protein [candidate division KSB1 bacterium]
MLKQKFGRIPLALQRRLGMLDDARLDRLILALLNIDSLQELNLWLRNGTAARRATAQRSR